MLQRTITRDEAKVLVETGKSPLLHKFISNKTKRAFSAFLKLGPDGKIGFEFEPRAPKVPAKRKPNPEAEAA